MSAIACALLFIGAMLLFFTDSRWIAAILIMAGGILILVHTFRIRR